MKRLRELFSKKTEPVTINLQAIHSWVTAQCQDDINHHLEMIRTSFGDMPQKVQACIDAAHALKQAQIRKEDFPDAGVEILKLKIRYATHIMHEMGIIMDAITDRQETIEGYQTIIGVANSTLDSLEQYVSRNSDTVRRYFVSYVYALRDSFVAVEEALRRVEDVLETTFLVQLRELFSHLRYAEQKLENKQKWEDKKRMVQHTIDEHYEEYLEYQTRIKDIAGSTRYQLETVATTFSALEYEKKSLEQKQQKLKEKLQLLDEAKQKVETEIGKCSVHEHVDRISQLLKSLTNYDVEIIYS